MGLFKTKQTIEPDAIPTTVEEAIPVQDFYEDGIALVGRGLWSKTFRFSDINYARRSCFSDIPLSSIPLTQGR